VLPAEADRDYLRVRGTRLGRRYKVANVPAVDTKIESINEFEAAETAANARLIAAAPELLEALQLAHAEMRAMRSAVGAGLLTDKAIDTAEDAIANATGVAP
jgi:hypothetical protein